MTASVLILAALAISAILTGTSATTTKSPTTVPQVPGCLSEIQACNQQLAEKMASVTSVGEYCKFINELRDCVLKTKTCDEDYIRNDVVPMIYADSQQQGLDCGSGDAPTNSSIIPASTTPLTTNTAVSGCEGEINWCVSDYTKNLAMATTSDDHCRLLEDLSNCYLKTSCDEDFVRNALITGTYQEAQRRGLWCEAPKPDTCKEEAQECLDTLERKLPYVRNSEVCGVIYDYQNCMWSTHSCDYDFIAREIDHYYGDSIRDCDRDSSVSSGQRSLRSHGWSVWVSVVALTGLMQQAMTSQI